METVRTKSGEEIPRPVVDTTMLALRSLSSSNPIALYELVMRCRDSSHVMFGNTAQVTAELGLTSHVANGRVVVHDAVRSVVLSAVSGEGFDMTIGEPVNGGGE